MLIRAMLDGGIFAALLPPLATVAAPLFGASAGTVPHPIALALAWIAGVLIGAIPMVLIAVAFMAPLASFFAWPLYKRGVKSYATYIALGALVGFPAPLLLALSLRLSAGFDLSQFLFIGWFVISSAFGGWSFADQLSRQITPLQSA